MPSHAVICIPISSPLIADGILRVGPLYPHLLSRERCKQLAVHIRLNKSAGGEIKGVGVTNGEHKDDLESWLASDGK